MNYHFNGYQQQSRISENRYLTEIGRVMNTVPGTPLLSQNLPSNLTNYADLDTVRTKKTEVGYRQTLRRKKEYTNKYINGLLCK